MRERADFEKRALQNPVFRAAHDNYDLLTDLGEQLRAIRLESGLSQQDLEKLSGVDQAEISRIERAMSARERGPSLTLLARIARAAGYKLTVTLVKDDDVASDDAGAVLGSPATAPEAMPRAPARR